MTLYITEQAMNAHVLKDANGTTVRVHDYLRNVQTLAEKHGRRWITPRARIIAEQLGRCLRTIQRALADLRRRGALVSQTRFITKVGGIRRQIANRIRLISTAVIAVQIKAKADKTAATSAPYRGDNCVAPSTERLGTRPSRPWKTSQLYLDLMSRGLNKGARSNE